MNLNLFINVLALLLFWFLISKLTQIVTTKIRGNLKRRFLRNILFFLPYLLPFIYFQWPEINLNLDWKGCIISLVLGLGLITLEFKKLKILFNKDYYLMLDPIHLRNLLTGLNTYIGAAIFEELFFRGVTSSIDQENIVAYYIFGLLATLLFVYSHSFSLQKRDAYSYVVLTVFSFTQVTLYHLTGNIINCIIVHLIFNTPAIAILIRRYMLTKRGIIGEIETF
ncbi:CPBP family intramembrane metalloprotease [Bacillus cereus]|uniref:CPBP family glutamic-type intramembrane protease n=1 Tax=Bacillus cereus TaxID=1396 RepID=UPI0018F69FC6|nr:CPBP family glutamic-type intramembrane protease [Bacillus cereus]MBJ8055373.1 CPBP family intramembrane metalloprotease [Bacillus cereus]